jgi:hypothetical protein
MQTYPDDDMTSGLFQIAHDAALRRANGICERCLGEPASKVIRVKEVVWGAFDAPSNLLVVCEACREHTGIQGQ